MTPAHMLRAARRAAGVSQRQLAELSGTHAKTITDIESGRVSPQVGTLQRLLAATGSELVVDRAVPPACDHLERYLRMSLTTRLFVALGGRRWIDLPPVWTQLWGLVHHGTVQLVGSTAVAVWTPELVDRPQLRVFRSVSAPPRELPTTDALDIELVEGKPPRPLVPVRWRVRPVLVQAPYELGQTGVTPAQRLSLRAAAALLDAGAGRDDAGRRPPAHRDVDHWQDQRVLMRAKAFDRLPFPPEHDARGWRLEGPVSLAQWLRRHGYPT